MNHVITLIQLMSIASHLELTLGQTSLYMIEGKKLFVWVAMYLAPKYELVTLFLCLQLETGQVFYVLIDRTTRKPCRLQDKRQYLHFPVFQEFSRKLGWTPALLGYLCVLMSWKLCFLCCKNKPCCFVVCHYSLLSQARVERKSKMVFSGE